jgi:hypothetical protein
MLRSCPRQSLVFRGCRRLVEGDPCGSQEKEELAGPEQDIQKAAAFEIIKILGMETDVERLAGTLFDESPHGSQVDWVRAEAAAPGVQAFEVLIAREQEMLQAEILLIQ